LFSLLIYNFLKVYKKLRAERNPVFHKSVNFDAGKSRVSFFTLYKVSNQAVVPLILTLTALYAKSEGKSTANLQTGLKK